MSDQFVAEIRIFPFAFATNGWALCNGQLMPISQNTALFSLLGTTYGGDGKSTFALPNLQGMAPMQQGQGQGLSLRDLGESAGEQYVTLLTSEMPLHPHAAMANGTGTVNGPAGNFWAASLISKAGAPLYMGSSNTQMNGLATGLTGGSQPHNNLMPYLTLNFCIALQGIYPPRS